MKSIKPEELADIIKSDKIARKDYIVVDVRDDDYAGGNITGCLNRPSSQLQLREDIGKLVREIQDVPLVVFHCALSQVRGPSAAKLYEETKNNLDGYRDKPQEIVVLQDGFSLFQEKYKDDPVLVENWDKGVWDPEVEFTTDSEFEVVSVK